jgi:ribonuclease BN (tRNA processing enzyme)
MGEEMIKVFDASLTSLYVNHPAFALGYRISVNGHSLVYISDNEPFDREVARSMKNVDRTVLDRYLEVKGDPNQRVFDFARGADVLIHDATYTPEEYVNHVGWGHSHYLFALKVADEAGVKTLVLFHHDQMHDDSKIDEIQQKCIKEIKTHSYKFACLAAAEGVELEW